MSLIHTQAKYYTCLPGVLGNMGTCIDHLFQVNKGYFLDYSREQGITLLYTCQLNHMPHANFLQKSNTCSDSIVLGKTNPGTGTRRCWKCLWEWSEHPWKSLGAFGYGWAIFKNPGTPMMPDWLKKSWQVYNYYNSVTILEPGHLEKSLKTNENVT